MLHSRHYTTHSQVKTKTELTDMDSCCGDMHVSKRVQLPFHWAAELMNASKISSVAIQLGS